MLDDNTIFNLLEFFRMHGKPKHKKVCFAYKEALFFHVYEDEIENVVIQYEYEYGGFNEKRTRKNS